MKKIVFGLVFITSMCYARVDYFRLYGDIFAFLPAFAGIYTLVEQDYEGLAYLGIATASTLATAFAIKYSLASLAKSNESIASISRRPDGSGYGSKYEGFPSGHTSSAFSAAGFMQRRYGSLWGIPTTMLATLVGVSRITSQKHTIFQVLAGAALGYSMGYFITKRRVDIVIDQRQSKAGKVQGYYGLSFGMMF